MLYYVKKDTSYTGHEHTVMLKCMTHSIDSNYSQLIIGAANLGCQLDGLQVMTERERR